MTKSEFDLLPLTPDQIAYLQQVDAANIRPGDPRLQVIFGKRPAPAPEGNSILPDAKESNQ